MMNPAVFCLCLLQPCHPSKSPAFPAYTGFPSLPCTEPLGSPKQPCDISHLALNSPHRFSEITWQNISPPLRKGLDAITSTEPRRQRKMEGNPGLGTVPKQDFAHSDLLRTLDLSSSTYFCCIHLKGFARNFPIVCQKKQ